MDWVSVAIVLNGIANLACTIATVSVSKRMKKEMNDLRSDMQKKDRCIEEHCRDNSRRIYAIEEENKKRNEEAIVDSMAGKHPLYDETFIYGGIWRTKFGNGKEVNDDYLKSVARIATNAILPVVPDELRTYEVIKVIISYMTEAVGNQNIIKI